MISIIKKFFATSRYNKPHGALLLYFPCIWGLSFNNHNITEVMFLCIIFFFGAYGMRSLGCIWNDYNDREIDLKVERTKNRFIASKKINTTQILIFGFFNAIIGSIPLFFLPINSILLSIFVIPLILIYPRMKRITWWPQFWLGLSFNWGILVGFSISGDFFLTPTIFLFYIGGVLFTIGYDTIYGYQDIKDDEVIGVKSTSLKFKNSPRFFLFSIYTLSFGFWLISLLISKKPFLLIIIFIILSISLLAKVLLTDFKNSNSCNASFIANSYYSLFFTLILILL